MNDTPKQDKRWQLESDLTIYNVAAAKQQLEALLQQTAEIETDLAQVSEIDSAGMQLLILAKRECLARNGSLSLSGHSQAVLEVLDLCNMANYFGDPVVLPGSQP